MINSKHKNSDRLIFNELMRLLIILLFTAVNARLGENNADFAVSCDDTVMQVRITFKHPFEGIVFVPEHYYDTACSYGTSPNKSVLEITLTLPHDSCKMKVTNSSNKLLGLNTLAIFHHRMLETVYDYSQNVTCELKYPVKDLNKNIWREPFLRTWISFEHPSSVLPEDLLDKMEDVLLLVYHVKDRGVHGDMQVINCIGHDATTVNEKTKFYQLFSGCSRETDLLSNFTVLRNPVGGEDMIAYAIVKNFSLVVRRRLYITCGAQICEDKCEQKCENLQQNFSDIVTKGLVNRPEGSKRPTSLTTFERFDRRSQNDTGLDEFPLPKIREVLPLSSNERISQVFKLNREPSEELIRSKRAIMRQKTEVISSGLNVIVISSDEAVALSNVKLQFETKIDDEKLITENSTDLCDSVLKVKMTFEPQHSSRIDGEDEKFNFTSFLRAVIAIFTLMCISAACYSLFSFRRQTDSDYASHI